MPPRFPNAAEKSFAGFNNRYAGGSCYVVGRGPTRFDYEELTDFSDPIFFVNDAVCLEKYARSETFFFAHDATMRVWLNGAIRATAVLPVNGDVFSESSPVLGHDGAVAFYQRTPGNRMDLLRASRDEIAALRELYTNTGTIHSLLHFAWYCGFKRITLIGCDGIDRHNLPRCAVPSANGYDVRLRNLSRTSPWWHYSIIRDVQDRLMSALGLEAVYRGTPTVRK